MMTIGTDMGRLGQWDTHKSSSTGDDEFSEWCSIPLCCFPKERFRLDGAESDAMAHLATLAQTFYDQENDAHERLLKRYFVSACQGELPR